MAIYIQAGINGLMQGAIYATIAVGFALIYNILKFSNFSHSGVLVVTAYVGCVIRSTLKTNFFLTLILGGGIVFGGVKGALGVLKDFSLPISMSFRLFGALLSGLLVTELVYYSISLSFALPIIVAVLFTLLHAGIQAYVLTTLVSIFYGEAVEPKPRKEKVKKRKESQENKGVKIK